MYFLSRCGYPWKDRINTCWMIWKLYLIQTTFNFVLIIIPLCWLKEGDNDDDSDEEEAPELTQCEAICWLAILTVWVSILSGYLVDAIQVKSIWNLNSLCVTELHLNKTRPNFSGILVVLACLCSPLWQYSFHCVWLWSNLLNADSWFKVDLTKFNGIGIVWIYFWCLAGSIWFTEHACGFY